jgi:serine/threonine-protein kinase
MPKFCPACRERFPPDALFCPNDGTPLLTAPKFDPGEDAGPDPYLGREISGHIEVKQLAGVGAMGRVYRAFQKGIDRDVAVKILHRELSANPQLVSRFHREAKVASRLQHPNVVHVHLAGQLPDGALYIVMEFLDGMSLQSALNASNGAMPLPRALHVGLQLCDAVGEAHVQGIVHRDLKPENVMLVKRGQDTDYVKVLDFGIARLSWGEQSMATAAGLIFGTARYISPEGAQGEAVGPAGDVYAIATLLFQMLAGRTPFEGDQAVGLLIQQIHDQPPQLQSIPRAAYVPDPVAAVIMQNLAKSPHARAPDARALARSILEAARMSGLSSDDFAPPSLRISGQIVGAMKLAPMQQTKQLQLSPEMQERLSPTAPPADSSPESSGPIAIENRSDEKAQLRPGSLPTAKWTPSPAFQAQIAPRQAHDTPKLGVDETLDDDDGAPPAQIPQAAPSAPNSIPATAPTPPPSMSQPSLSETVSMAPQPTRTEIGTTPPILAPSYPPPNSYPPTAPANPAGYGVAPPTPTPPPQQDTAPRTMHTPTPPHPTYAPPEDDTPQRWLRHIAVFILVFFGAVVFTGLILYKLGYVDAPTSLSTARIDDQVARANDALLHERWDAPPGDNVKDITDAALVRWPHEPRIVDIRARACDELVKRAIGLQMKSDLTGALHLARLATDLDPQDDVARKLAKEYEGDLASADAGVTGSDLDASLPPINSSRPVPTQVGPHASLEASPLKPKLGQSVEFTAHAFSASGGNPKSVSDAAFTLSGPGIGAGTKLSAMSEGSTFRGGFSFLEAGKYEIDFTAKVDGASVRAVRNVVVEGPGGSANPNGNNQTPTPPPSASVKWL